MLSVLLEQHHGEKARAGKAARQHAERRRRLRDPLARPARELLPNVLQHLPLPRHHLERLAHVLAELSKPGRPAARARGRAGHDDPLARQMLRERLAGGPPAGERAVPSCRGRGPLGGELILRRRRLELLKFEFHLVQKARAALAALAVDFASHLLDREPQMRDQSLGAGSPALRLNESRLAASEVGLSAPGPGASAPRRHPGVPGDGHERRRADSPPSVGTFFGMSHPAAPGRHVRCGCRQSMASSK